MNKKIFLTLTITMLFLIIFATYTLAANNTTQNVRNTIMDAGNKVGNVVSDTKNAVINGTKNIGNGAATLGQDAVNTTTTMGNDAKNTVNGAVNTLNNNNGNYTAMRTSSYENTNLFGMSNTAWTWLILGIVGIIIIALVWYYGAQYEHRNYDND